MSKKTFQRGKQYDTTSNEKGKESYDIRTNNILAGKAVADACRTSLGPKGMDKMLVELSKAQDIEAGDGTTSVVVIAGSMLNSVQKLMSKGIHPTIISDSFKIANDKAASILRNMSESIDLKDFDKLVSCAKISLASKVVAQHSEVLAPIAVKAVLDVIDMKKATNVDLNDIKVVKKLGGNLDDCSLIDGIVFPYGASRKAGGPTKRTKAKIGLIQFCLSAPKTDMDHSVVVDDYSKIDQIIDEERTYIINMCKQIKKTGCNVLLIQKSILRDAVSELSLSILSKMKIMVVRNIDRKDVPFICKTLNIRPIASLENMKKEKLGYADLAEEVGTEGGKIIKITGIKNKGKTVSAFLRASNELMLDETERSFHDALCVVRAIVKERKIIVGGGAPEIEICLKLAEYAKQLSGLESLCVKEYGEAFEVIPTTLAENAGINPITVVTELRNKHIQGKKNHGINCKTGQIVDMTEMKVIQPLLVNLSAINLATETVNMILKIDGILV